MLLYHLPEGHCYRVLMMRRNPEEVVASQQRMLQRRGETGADLSPQKLMEVFGRQMEKLLQWLDQQPHFDLLQVDYADVVADPLREARRIVAWLGAPLDVNAMAAAVDPALYRQRR